MRSLFVAATVLCVGCLEPADNMLALKDAEPPAVLPETSPSPNEVIDPAATITVVFSETMDPASLERGVLLLYAGTEVPHSLVLPAPDPEAPPPNVERFDRPYPVNVAPQAPLVPEIAYELVITPEVTDYEGNALPAEVRIPFRTAPEP